MLGKALAALLKLLKSMPTFTKKQLTFWQPTLTLRRDQAWFSCPVCYQENFLIGYFPPFPPSSTTF